MRIPTPILALLCAAALLPQGCQGREPTPASQNPFLTQHLLSERDLNRAFEGAPPVIPHGVDDLGRENCMACHADGSAVSPTSGRPAPVTPHPTRMNCVQCHVQRLASDVFTVSAFEPLRQNVGARPVLSQPLAPPYIPHRMQDREDCVGCHLNVTVPAAIRPEHGMRTNCTQCHIQLQTAVAPFTAAVQEL